MIASLHYRHYYYSHITDKEMKPREVKQFAWYLMADYNLQKWLQQYFWSHVPFQNVVVSHQEAKFISSPSELGLDLVIASMNRIPEK